MFPTSESSSEDWTVLCEAVRAHDVHPCAIEENLDLLDDHPLLIPHRKDWATLSFSGGVAEVNSLVGALYRAHMGAVANWIPFDEFINPCMGLGPLLETGNGVLATGPVPLLDVYEAVLRDHGVRSSRYGERGPVWRDGAEWDTDSSGVRVILLDQQFVIAGAAHATPA